PYSDYFITSVQVLNPDLSVAWRSPSTGTAKGMVLDIESAGPQQPIYVGGTPRFLDIYDWNGILLQALNDAPADVLFPNSDGLNTVSYAAYLEHFDGVTFDWGQSYWGTQEPESVNIAGYAPKYNALYF